MDMNLQSDLPMYPHVPGFKTGGTSAQAAFSIAPDADTLRASCLEALRSCPMTADEVAERLGASILSVRPRISELANPKIGAIKIMTTKGWDDELKCEVDIPVRRKNASGHSASVWTVVQK
jgi:hypothetical protein